jgi:LuxR family transcriptional regulator, maltose regulon positive regulatory protein
VSTPPATILTTKLHRPRPDTAWLVRSRLFDQLDAGTRHRITLVSAPAGYGKTTLLAAWVDLSKQPAAWLSLDAADRDPARFATYLTLALQTLAPDLGSGVLRSLQSGQAPPLAALLTTLINELAAASARGVIVLDDYHLIDSADIDSALALFVEHLPPHVRVILATREDPDLPLARWRVRGQLNEIRIDDLRFSAEESGAFLDTRVAARLTDDDVRGLQQRTEGWAAGLQLASLSLQGAQDTAGFVRSFTGSHRFVLDYLVEEVLNKQPADVQHFLLRTSVLQRMCGPLCDAVVGGTNGAHMLEHLERANLFVIPLDSERRWFRYHHLFAELLQQRLASSAPADSPLLRASAWCESQGLDLEAFEYAVAAKATEHALRLAQSHGMPLHFRGGLGPVLRWLEGLPQAVAERLPELYLMHASALLFAGRLERIPELVDKCEAVFSQRAQDPITRDLLGRAASIRATLAVSQHDADTIDTQARRALALINPSNLPVRSSLIWNLGYAHQLKGARTLAYAAYREALGMAEELRHGMVITLSELGLAVMHEDDEEFDIAIRTYRHVIALCGEPAQPVACQAHLGLARIAFAQADFETAEREARRAETLARQLPMTDRAAAAIVWQARIALACGYCKSAREQTARADRERAPDFARALPAFASDYALLSLESGDATAAARLAEHHQLHLVSAQAALALNQPDTAEQALDQFDRLPRQDISMADRRWAEHLREAIAKTAAETAVDPLSERELEVLRLVAAGLSNQDIATQLHLALSSVKGHNLRIFAKLQVRSRTEAIARARAAGFI